MVEAIERLDPLTFGRLNQEFHAVIYEHCPNAALVDLLSDVARRLDAIRRTVFVQIPYRGAESVAEAPPADRAALRRRAAGQDRGGRAGAQAQHGQELPGLAGGAPGLDPGAGLWAACRPR